MVEQWDVEESAYFKEVETSRVHINQNLLRAYCGLWNVCRKRYLRRMGKVFHDECPHGSVYDIWIGYIISRLSNLLITLYYDTIATLSF